MEQNKDPHLPSSVTTIKSSFLQPPYLQLPTYFPVPPHPPIKSNQTHQYYIPALRLKVSYPQLQRLVFAKRMDMLEPAAC